jgi:anti-sigma-K factor RskA
MRYDDPRHADLLAGEYVLGVLPRRARQRLDRLMERDPVLARRAAAWAERWAPIDRATSAVIPPERVWRAIEGRIGHADLAAADRPVGWWNLIGLWRALAFGATAVAAALAVYIAVLDRAPTLPAVVAVLSDQAGAPAWIATRADGQVEVSPVRAQRPGAGRAYELWAITGGPPRSLGLLPTDAGRGLAVPENAVAAPNLALAVSLEPAGGSPTGLPTGPVLWQGKVLPD